ncbi:MAG: GntR family transcriptional regulator [Desulfofustis sp.]|nr:GntR family transcriptional regulator [Desulfofustis sp.]MBT8347731.1 GntR family transcriptional regulator [Desulfofustis sp.]
MKKTVIRQSLKDQVESILIDRMIEGDLAPGDRIKELQVAKELGTSQAPVREAIRCLETLGYVEHIPHVGAMVKTFNRSEIEEAYQVREALELHSTGLIAEVQNELVKKLDEQLALMRSATKAHNIRMFTQADNEFHRAIVASCENETMLAMWESLKMQVQVIATLVKASMPLDKIYLLHPPIVDAFKSKSRERASLLLKGHYKILGSYWENLK